MAGLGGGVVKGAERHIIGTLLTRFHGEVPAVVAGAADLGAGAQQRTRLGQAAIPLPQVHAIGAGLLRQIGAVIQDEGDIMGMADRQQRLAGAQHLVIAHVLQAQLEGGHRATIQRRLQAFGEGRQHDLRRRDHVKLAGRPLFLLEAVGKVRRQRDEIVVAHAADQALPR